MATKTKAELHEDASACRTFDDVRAVLHDVIDRLPAQQTRKPAATKPKAAK